MVSNGAIIMDHLEIAEACPHYEEQAWNQQNCGNDELLFQRVVYLCSGFNLFALCNNSTSGETY